MRKSFTLILFLIICQCLIAQEKITFMPNWSPQAQFAGYYVALEKGFYANKGLDVTIEHVGMNSSKPGTVRLKQGEVDIIVSHPIQALIARNGGLPLVNVLQIFQNTGLMIVCHKAISDIKALEGMKVGIWETGFSEVCEVCLKSNGVHVEWVPYLNGINLFISKAIDATVVMSYNELNLLREAMGEIPEDHIIKFSDYGYKIPEDGLYVTEEYLATHGKIVNDFKSATKNGWKYCKEHPEEALDIVMDYVAKAGIKTSRFHQGLMLKGALDLITNINTGNLDFLQLQEGGFNKMVSYLVSIGYLSRPITYNEFVR